MTDQTSKTRDWERPFHTDELRSRSDKLDKQYGRDSAPEVRMLWWAADRIDHLDRIRLQSGVGTRELEILLHTLGLNRSPEMYRNYFEPDVGEDLDTCRSLAERGLMYEVSPPPGWPEGVYAVTNEGKHLVMSLPRRAGNPTEEEEVV